MNEINGNPENTFTVGHNMFSTWTKEEKKKLMGKKQGVRDDACPPPSGDFNDSASPEAVDWRKEGAVTAVQSQGDCGGCWAFATIAALEGANKISTGTLDKLSEQQFIDCVEISDGCEGGIEQEAFMYAMDHAVELESEYKFTARTGTCRASQSKGHVKATDCGNVPTDKVSALRAAIAKGPTTVAVYADADGFLNYHSGIYNDFSACEGQVDHAITAVGYGSEGGNDYWIVKNSWGANWGEAGFGRLAIKGDGRGICGIMSDAVTVSV